MPRRKAPAAADNGPSDDDLASMQAALAGTLSQVSVSAWPADDWQRLALATLHRGYSVVLSPALDGRAVTITVPLGTQRLRITATTNQELVEAVRALTLQVERLKVR